LKNNIQIIRTQQGTNTYKSWW